MDYEIVNLYTEHLNISSFKSIVDEENIESLAKFNTSIIPLNQDNLTEDVLLNDETIEEFVNETMDKISFLLNSKLPNLIEEIKRKK